MSDDPKESGYYLRLVSMYMDIGTETVLGVFVHLSPGKDAETFLKANQHAIIKMKTEHILNEQECASLLQKGTNVLKSPLDLNRFDVSLLITLARNLFTSHQLPPPAKGWKYPPRNKDKSVAADLMRLKTIRNVIVGHHPRARLPKWRFDDEWQEVSEIILRLQQQIAPGNKVHIEKRIDEYRVQRLDPSVENKYDEKLKEWHEEVTNVQDQVEELIKKLEGFDAYFKNKNDRFERYTKLLTKGGHFVLSALLDKKMKKQGIDLRSLLDDKEDTLKRNVTDSKQLDFLYPSTNATDPLDTSSWDVSLLATVILQLFDSTKERDINQDVKNIGDAQRNHADAALVALDSNTFEDYWTDLKASIKIVSRELDEDKAAQCHQILEECKKRISEKEFQTYMDELKAKGSQMKSFTDIFKDTLKKTQEFLQDMITHGINFKNGHELELKMITLGKNEEKKELAEKILTEVWHEALDRSIQTTYFPEVKKEVLKILEEIKKSKSVKNITISKKCILLQITCTSPNDLLNMINYFESENCHESFGNISKELGYYLNTALAVYYVVPIDCLWAISNLQDESTQPEERGVRLPITVSSPAGMKHLISLCGREEIANSTNSIADALSKHLDDTIELKTSTDMKELGTVFDADKSSSDSSSDCSTTESSVINSNQLKQPDVSEKFSEEKSPGNMPEELTVQELDDKTDHLKECHKDKSIQKETESDIYTSQSSDSDGSDWASQWTERETKIKRYRNWVKSGLALHIFKTELNTICDEAVATQHKGLIDKVKGKKGVSILSCNKCNLKTLLPDHVQTEHKQCPLDYMNCNCLNPVEKSACPNNLCGALYDDIIGLYKATPPTPIWENTNVHTWCTDPWSIAKCFISKSVYATKTKASEFDIEELFLLMKNNKELFRYLKRYILPPIILFPEVQKERLSQLCRHRDRIYYSKEMELDWITSFTDRDALRQFYMACFGFDVPKFPDDDYIVTSKDEAIVHADVIAALSEEAKYLEQKITSCQETNLSEKEIEDEEVHVKKRRFDSIPKESLQAVQLPPESEVERLEPGISGQEVPVKKRRLESTIYGHSYAINMPTKSEAGQEPTTSYRTDHSVKDIEDYTTQLEKIKTLISVHKESMAYIGGKIDLQKRLVKLYQDHIVKVPALPIQPEQNQKDIDDVYVDPWMTILEKDDPDRKASEQTEREISSFFDIFEERGTQIKNVYVLGEAGTGKSIFCKNLIQKWCKVHMKSDMGGRLNLGKEMKILKGFEFLFFILLRHHLDKPTIKMMLDGQFGHPILQKILDTESDKCLILLDGLDEWIPKSLCHSQIQTKGLPARDINKDYTIVTTSRPWKIGILGRKRNEIHQIVMLRGINKNALKILTEKTITLLNAMLKQDRNPLNFIKYLKTSPLSDIQHIPILLQQLICLWCENSKLTSSTKSTLYSGMLELPFKWLDQGKREGHKSDVGSEAVQIPHASEKVGIYQDYKQTLNSASKLAFEILFKHEKEHTLSFDFQTCKRLQVPADVLKVCVNIGILSEDKNIGFSTDVLNESSFSFVHKSIQEFLAALHIAKTLSHAATEWEEAPSLHPMTELEHTTFLSNQSKLDDLTSLRPASEQDTKPRHPFSDIVTNPHTISDQNDVTSPHPRVERENITSPRPSSQWENITYSQREDITSPRPGLQRDDNTFSHTGTLQEDITSKHPGLGRENLTSLRPRLQPENITFLHTGSEQMSITSPHSGSEREDMTFPHSGSEREDKTSLLVSFERENISFLHTGSEREDATFLHYSLQRENVMPPHASLEREGSMSPHVSKIVDTVDTSHLPDMSERKYSWSTVFGDFVQKYCTGITTVENILELANVFIFLSGLQPNLVTNISKYIHRIVNRDIHVIQHRTMLEECAFLHDIQACISSCCHEASSDAQCDPCHIYLGDCFIDDSKFVHPSLNIFAVQQVISDGIKSLSISFSRACQLQRVHSKCDICSILTYFSSCRRLTKLELKDKRLQADDRHIYLITEILERNFQTLRMVSVDCILGVCLKGMESFEPLITSIPKLNRLTSLEVRGIRLLHEQCDILTSYLADEVRLQELSLDIECAGKDDHEINMSMHDTLQYLEIGDGFTVTNVYTKHDMTIKFKITRSNDLSITRLFRILESVNLKHVSLWGNRHDASVPDLVTHYLCSLLAKANYLCAIELDSLKITRNILTCPYKLINLKRIDLSLITMTMMSWEAFIDSLPKLPNAVHVKTLGLVIKDFVNMHLSRSMLYERKTVLPIPSKAFDYVRNQDKLFHVTRDKDYLFEFLTHKYQHW
ncbi:uncharacterized protein LOC123532743 [Mercenaria mercenaria]|uniref:uncharacterized protein LOC123532743 n=1 Tax=Mercenaria mercenaria TaxID=6596 RepID=UPI00234E96FF|nr:uncharacterized protein LOC123532743 [Mercenaria mercenaria]